MKSQEERIQAYYSLTQAEIESSIVRCRIRGSSFIHDIALFLSQAAPIYISAFWFVIPPALFFAVPIDISDAPWSFSNGIARAVVFLHHIMFVAILVSYICQVVCAVPWKALQKPLVESLDTIETRNTGFIFVASAAVYIYFEPGNGWHPYAIAVEACVILYLHYFEPAFGFVPWKRRDQQKVDAIQLQAPAQASTQSQPNVNQAEDGVYSVPFVARKANKTFTSIHGMQAIKDSLLEPAKAVLDIHRDSTQDAPRNGFLLHGEPGNGKTVFAEALAGELNVPFIEVTFGPISSQWLGNMPKSISNTFAYAKRCAPCVLFIDEVDSFIKSRDAGMSFGDDLKITNTLLTEIVSLRSSNVVLMAATNFLASLDAAAIREGRFDYKVEITPPDAAARIGLLNDGISKHCAGLPVNQSHKASVAARWNGFSVARLIAVCKALPSVVEKRKSSEVGYDDWMAALREVQGRKGRLPTDTKRLGDLVLGPDTRASIDLLASRFADVSRIESLGGSLPTGVLFFGPSGTGKTAAARALAQEVGWAFLSVAGPDLIADRSKLEKTFSEAKELRPTLVFIDEADDVLRDRRMSATPDVVNKLLTIMDGVEDKVRDVVWIAATNHPDQIDAALLRSGRFTEKVFFDSPPAEMLPKYIAGWLKRKAVALHPSADIFDLAQDLEGCTIADVDGTLQYALNVAISSTAKDGVPLIGRSDIKSAMKVVLQRED